MIGKITGSINHIDEKTVIINTAGGVGYMIYVTSPTKTELIKKKDIELLTYLVVREDTLDLYGFIDNEELTFFKLLLKVSGVGPKGALNILSVASPEVLQKATASGQVDYLKEISGIGPKSAQKIILELKDKLKNLTTNENINDEDTEALSALKALGFSGREAYNALQKISPDIKTVNEKIKAALKNLNSGH
ncbi:MAG: Holliday junction branch migration protein RuvA [Patescibacteria group bacterium]